MRATWRCVSVLTFSFVSLRGCNNSFSFLVGYMFATIFMSIVASAVNTVIVCFAEAPAEFETNHPALSAQMRAAWTQAWPELVF